MTQDSGIGNKEFFRYVLTSGTPVKFAGSSRDAVYVFNEGGPSIRMGSSSDIAKAYGTLLPSGAVLLDSYSDDDWYAVSLSGGTGTISGFIVRS